MALWQVDDPAGGMFFHGAVRALTGEAARSALYLSLSLQRFPSGRGRKIIFAAALAHKSLKRECSRVSFKIQQPVKGRPLSSRDSEMPDAPPVERRQGKHLACCAARGRSWAHHRAASFDIRQARDPPCLKPSKHVSQAERAPASRQSRVDGCGRLLVLAVLRMYEVAPLYG